ncbi:hypothetical protein FXO37_21482 [Capsicum annuum]|nr:hypothetical protein FXO37_21482 [Capsicum annuum]
MRKLMWWCSWSSYDEEFKDQLKKLGQLSEEAARDWVNFPPKAWCRLKSNRDGELDEEKSAEGASRKGKSPIIESNLQSKIVGEEDDLEQIQVATQDFEPYGLDVGNEEDLPRRSMVYPEFESWVEKLMTRDVPTGTKKISFTGDHTGVLVPTNLPYSPVKTTWKGKKSILFWTIANGSKKKKTKMGVKDKGGLAPDGASL